MSGKFFYNKIVTRNQAIVLNQKAGNQADLRDFIWDVILADVDYDPERKTIYADYIVNLYKFCLQNHYSAEKVSTLLSISKYIFNDSIEKKLRFNESYELLRSLLQIHGIQREPYYMGIFGATERADILKYFTTSFYKHYTLYDVAMTKTINYKVSLADMFSIDLPRPTPLGEGKEIDPELIPELREFIPKVEVADEKEDQGGEEEGSEGEEQLGEEQKEEKNSPIQKHFIKTEEDLKLESALEQTLKGFYNKLDSQLKEKSDEMAVKIQAKMPKQAGKK